MASTTHRHFDADQRAGRYPSITQVTHILVFVGPFSHGLDASIHEHLGRPPRKTFEHDLCPSSRLLMLPLTHVRKALCFSEQGHAGPSGLPYCGLRVKLKWESGCFPLASCNACVQNTRRE